MAVHFENKCNCNSWVLLIILDKINVVFAIKLLQVWKKNQEIFQNMVYLDHVTHE